MLWEVWNQFSHLTFDYKFLSNHLQVQTSSFPRNQQPNTSRRKYIMAHNCVDCNKSFAYKSRLQIHMLTHSREKPHKCQLCPAEFLNKRTFKETSTDIQQRKALCMYCVWQKVLSKRDSLKRHLFTHSERNHIVGENSINTVSCWILNKRKFKETSTDTQWRKALCMYCVWQKALNKTVFEESPSIYTFSRETF